MKSAVYFEQELIETLKASKDIENIIGKNKIFAIEIPKGTKLPCISFQRIEGRPANTLLGHSGLEQITMQIDCWSLRYDQVKDLSIAVRAAMPSQGKRWGAHLIQDMDLCDGETNETRYYRVMMRYVIWFLENADDIYTESDADNNQTDNG